MNVDGTGTVGFRRGHSGGGLFISTEDHARFGLLFLNQGKWEGEQIISPEWIKEATTPSPANPSAAAICGGSIILESSRYVAEAERICIMPLDLEATLLS